MADLSTAPESPIDANGEPTFGTYRGHCADTDLSAVSSNLDRATGRRFLREKKWQWFAAANEQIACGGTLLDAGYASVIFIWLFDRLTNRMIADEADILPPFAVEISNNPGPGGGAQLRGLRRHFSFVRHAERIDVEISSGDLDMEFEIDTTATDAVTAICPVDHGDQQGVNVTQKQNCLPIRGRVSTEGRSFRFSEPDMAMLDFTHGLLGRESAWHWAIGGGAMDDGTPVGFNFVQGFNDDLENVIWLGDDIRTTDSVEIDFNDKRPRDPWDIRSSTAAIDLSLYVEGLRDHHRNFRIVTSDYLQPLGRWHGRVVDREVHDLFGVAEQHQAKW